MSQPPDEDPVERELRWVREAAAKRAEREVSPLSKPVKRIRFLTLLKWAALILCAPLTLLLAIIVSPVLWPEPVGGQLEPTLWNACIEKSDLPACIRYRSEIPRLGNEAHFVQVTEAKGGAGVASGSG